MARKYYNFGNYTPCGKLPKNVYMKLANTPLFDEDDVVGMLSDEYGYCISSCDVSVNNSTNTIYISNINWDTKE